MNTNSNQTIEWEFTDITPERVLLQLYNTLIKNGVHHVRLQQFAKIIDTTKWRIYAADINTIRVQWLSLISLLYQYGYEREAQMFLSIEWVEKNDIDIFIGKLLFVFWVSNSIIGVYIKDFLINGDINAIPNTWSYPEWSILHFLVTIYSSHKGYSKYDIIGLIENLLWIPWFNINSLDTNWCSVLDNLFYEVHDIKWNIDFIETFLEENWAVYYSVKWKEIRKNIEKYRNKIQETVTPWFSVTAR